MFQFKPVIFSLSLSGIPLTCMRLPSAVSDWTGAGKAFSPWSCRSTWSTWEQESTWYPRDGQGNKPSFLVITFFFLTILAKRFNGAGLPPCRLQLQIWPWRCLTWRCKFTAQLVSRLTRSCRTYGQRLGHCGLQTDPTRSISGQSPSWNCGGLGCNSRAMYSSPVLRMNKEGTSPVVI